MSKSEILDRLVAEVVSERSVDEIALGWLRYEALRRISPRRFEEIHRENLAGQSFDDIVTEELISWKGNAPRLSP